MRIKTISFVVLLIFVSLVFATAQELERPKRALPPTALDAKSRLSAVPLLTGVWQTDDLGTYQVRQEGTKVWWYGRSPNNGRDWQNVFFGTVTNNQLFGEWADLPPGSAQHSGNLTLQIQAEQLIKVQQTGGFGGSTWHRVTQLTGGGGCSVGDIDPQKIDPHSVLPKEGKPDSVTGLPPIDQNVLTWFKQSAPVLENLLRRLAGDEAVSGYLAWEQRQNPNELELVDLRLKALNKLIR